RWSVADRCRRTALLVAAERSRQHISNTCRDSRYADGSRLAYRQGFFQTGLLVHGTDSAAIPGRSSVVVGGLHRDQDEGGRYEFGDRMADDADISRHLAAVRCEARCVEPSERYVSVAVQQCFLRTGRDRRSLCSRIDAADLAF